MRIAAVQHDIVWEDPAANFARLAPMIEGAASNDARLVVLTEMYATGFSMDTDRIAEPFDGPSAQFLEEQARAHGVWVCGSVPELQPGHERPSNCLVLAGPDGTVRRYAKIHPFSLDAGAIYSTWMPGEFTSGDHFGIWGGKPIPWNQPLIIHNTPSATSDVLRPKKMLTTAQQTNPNGINQRAFKRSPKKPFMSFDTP